MLDAGNALLFVESLRPGMFTVKHVGTLRGYIMVQNDREDYYWKNVRRTRWAKRADGNGWIQQRYHKRIRVPIERSRARDHTIVPSKIEENTDLRWWSSPGRYSGTLVNRYRKRV